MATWPAELPQCLLRDSFEATEGWSVIMAPVEGPPLSRRRYTAAPRPRAATCDLADAAALAVWEAFFYTTIAGGALPFDAAFEGGAVREYMIVGAPSRTPSGEGWRLSLNLMRLP